MSVLCVTASARRDGSISRALMDRAVARLQEHHPDTALITRDVGTTPPPLVSAAWIEAAFTPATQRTPEQKRLLAPSDELIAEVRVARIILIATPMYNYGMPAALKAWVDQIVRINETFSFDLGRGDFPLQPTLSGKTLISLTAHGEFGFEAGGPRETMNHLVPHLDTVSRYLGADRHHHVAVEYQEFGDHRHDRSIRDAHGEIDALIPRLMESAA